MPPNASSERRQCDSELPDLALFSYGVNAPKTQPNFPFWPRCESTLYLPCLRANFALQLSADPTSHAEILNPGAPLPKSLGSVMRTILPYTLVSNTSFERFHALLTFCFAKYCYWTVVRELYHHVSLKYTGLYLNSVTPAAIDKMVIKGLSGFRTRSF